MIIPNTSLSIILLMILFINLRIWGLVICDDIYDIIVIIKIHKSMLYLFTIFDNVLIVTSIFFKEPDYIESY